MNNSKIESTKNELVNWEMRPGGMLVQKRDDDDHDHDCLDGAASAGATVKIIVAHGPAQHEVQVPAQSTFGDLKKAIAQKTGLQPQDQKVLFRGKENEDSEHLHTLGVKDKSKVLVLEETPSKSKQLEEVKNSEENSEEMRKALQAVAGVRAVVDNLSERVAALEVAVNSGTIVSKEEFDVSTELLMRELLKLDDINAEGEAKLQRKAEVQRVQKFHETLDNLKARNSNPFSNSSNNVTVTTQWETFDSGMGSLNPPPSVPSSNTINQDWEQFD